MNSPSPIAAMTFRSARVITFLRKAGRVADGAIRCSAIPARVLEDVRDGYVSVDRREANYGVVIDAAAMTIDDDATTRSARTLRAATTKNVA